MRHLGYAAVAALCAFAAPGLAQTGLTVTSLKTFAYDSMVSWDLNDWRAVGVVDTVAVEGMVFLDIRAVFDVPWTEELTQLSVSSGDILLRLADGTEIQSFGSYRYWGMMHLSSPSISMSRPRDFPEQDEDLYWHALFMVPEGTATATLVIPGEPGFEDEVPIPATGPEQDAAGFAEFAVVDVDRFRQLALGEGRDSRRITNTVTAPAGYVMADLEVAISGMVANDFAPDGGFKWFTHNYRLASPEGVTMSPVGERFMDKLLGWQFNSVNVGDTAERRMVWLVPENLSNAVLYFGETPVADVDLSGAVADQG